MCLITEQKKPKRVKEDMIVYKTGYAHYNSNGNLEEVNAVFNFFNYLPHQLYETKFSFINPASREAIGYDDEVNLAYGNRNERSTKNLLVVAKGFHSAKNIERLKQSSNHCGHKFECIIPKGSLIYEDKTGLIVSDKIIIKKELLTKQ